MYKVVVHRICAGSNINSFVSLLFDIFEEFKGTFPPDFLFLTKAAKPKARFSVLIVFQFFSTPALLMQLFS